MLKLINFLAPIARRPDGELYRFTPKQARSIHRLTKECCNNVDGDCQLLDEGDPVTCPQSISLGLICKYFYRAVLPGDPKLESDIFNPKDIRRCQVCGQRFVLRSRRSKYCPECAKAVHRRQKAESARKRRSGVDN